MNVQRSFQRFSDVIIAESVDLYFAASAVIQKSEGKSWDL